MIEAISFFFFFSFCLEERIIKVDNDYDCKGLQRNTNKNKPIDTYLAVWFHKTILIIVIREKIEQFKAPTPSPIPPNTDGRERNDTM